MLKNPTPDTVENELQKLETVFQGTIATVENYEEYSNVMSFSTDPLEKLVIFEPLQITPKILEIEERVQKIIEVAPKFQLVQYRSINMNTLKQDIPSKAKDVQAMMKEFIYQTRDLGIYGGSIAILAVIVQMELNKLQCESRVEQKLYQSAITIADSVRHDLVRLMDCEKSEYNKLMVFGSPKLKLLLQVLNDNLDEKPEREKRMKALVFVQRRHSAKVVYHILKRVFMERFEDTDEPEIRPDFMVGRACGGLPESIEQILADKNQQRVIDRFRKDETNLIVASSVLEEGIDVQSCNLVIRFDLPNQFSSYVQSKGRARMKDSQFFMMIPKNDQPKFLKQLSTYRDVEIILKKLLFGKTINRKPALEKEVAEELYNQLIPPFYTKSGATLTAVSALNLLNRYAQTMPHDHFTSTSVYWEQINNFEVAPKIGVQVKLHLPIQSTVKEPVLSGKMENLKLAKRHAAFLACKQLYLNGELSDNLLPIDDTKKMIDVHDMYFKHWDDYPDDNPKIAGTKQNRRCHDQVFPEELTHCTPTENEVAYLYTIQFDPLFDAKFELNGIEDLTRKIYHQLIGNGRKWAIFTSKKIPKLPSMKLFLTQGEVRGTISSFPMDIVIQDKLQLEKLRKFHVMIFSKILNINKSFFAYDREGAAESYLIVPTLNNHIDWEIVTDFQDLKECKEPPEIWRKKMIFKPEDYLYKVIQPWYKLDRTKYIVMAVNTDKTPLSAFPEPEYANFADYFQQKYNANVVQPNQFMLVAKGIPSYLNLLHPGSDKDGASAKVNARFMRSEDYVPELCHNFGFPADLWLKAVMLPSILHRLRYILLAEKIRLTLNSHLALIDVAELLPIDVDKKIELDKKKVREQLPDSDGEEMDVEMNVAISPITYPNADKMTAQPSTVLTSLTENLEPWNEAAEPIDIDRHWDSVFPFELDYYVQFICKDFEDMKIQCYVESLAGLEKQTSCFIFQEKSIVPIKNVLLPENSRLNIFEVVPRAPHVRDVLKAITTAGANDVFDMERFEVLGDSFLKFAVSLYLINKHETWHEGYLTMCKGKIVSNRSLFYIASKFQLPGVLKQYKFDPKSDEWVPPLFKGRFNPTLFFTIKNH